MDLNTHARDAQLRAIAIFAKRPERAHEINRGYAEIHGGLRCIFQQDGQSLTLDMPSAIGGTAKGPSPGYFARAAICGCLAIGIKMTAVRENLRLDSVNVGIEQDWDNRGVLGMGGTSAVPSDTRITIQVTSPEPENAIKAMIHRALDIDPWFLAYRDPQPISTSISVTGGVS